MWSCTSCIGNPRLKSPHRTPEWPVRVVCSEIARGWYRSRAEKRTPSDAADAGSGAARWHVLGTAEIVSAELWLVLTRSAVL